MRKVAIKACNGQYVCAEGGGKQSLTANRGKAQGWETWDLIPLPPQQHGNNLYALRSHANGMYLCAEDNGKKPLIANRMACAAWETFSVEFNGNYARLRSITNGQYVSFNGQNLIANAHHPDSNETFLLEYLN